jgi:hypothetical protein
VPKSCPDGPWDAQPLSPLRRVFVLDTVTVRAQLRPLAAFVDQEYAL